MTFRKLALSLVLLAAVGSAATVMRASLREAAAERAYPAEGQILMVDGLPVHAVVMGQPAGTAPDVVLIHGSSGSTRDMSFALAPALAETYRVILIDRPGLGWSAARPKGHLLADQARAIQAAATQLGADRPIVLGQSYGGAVALAWALELPGTLAGLVPVSAASHVWPGDLSPYYKTLSHPFAGPIAATLLNAWVPKNIVQKEVAAVFQPQQMPDGYPTHFGPGMTLRRAALLANARQRAALKAQIVEMDDRYASLVLPVEIVHGTADDTVSLSIHSEQLEKDAPNAKLTRLAGIGHMPHQVAVADVVAAVDRAAIRAGLRTGS